MEPPRRLLNILSLAVAPLVLFVVGYAYRIDMTLEAIGVTLVYSALLWRSFDRSHHAEAERRAQARAEARAADERERVRKGIAQEAIQYLRSSAEKTEAPPRADED